MKSYQGVGRDVSAAYGNGMSVKEDNRIEELEAQISCLEAELKRLREISRGQSDQDPCREEMISELFDVISSGVAVYQPIDQGVDFVFLDFNKAGERIEGIEKSK